MRRPFRWIVLALGLCLPWAAQAHRAWMLPSATVLSGDDVWVTVDAAVSNDLFYFEHFPLRIANIGTAANAGSGRGGRPAELHITAPDGSQTEPKNGSVGRYRSTFDVHLTQKGTYKLALLNDGVMARYKQDGQTRRWRGSAEAFANEIPKGAEDVQATLIQSRMEVFVTSGKPTRETLKVSGKGLELEPLTHPNDLVAGDKASFRLLMDGKPAADLKVVVIPGGNRYRDKLGDMTLTTDKEGRFEVAWPGPGMYWMEAVAREDLNAQNGIKQRRASYTATLEVLP